jgi:4a-hydroxytetrahydrobiopterin dehydratase
MIPKRLSENEVAEHLAHIPNWKREDQTICADFQFPEFLQAIAFVNRVAEIAEERNHHPDIQIHWRTVRLSLTTHSAGGLTELDFALAEKIQEFV